jgi:hypothetical protein
MFPMTDRAKLDRKSSVREISDRKPADAKANERQRLSKALRENLKRRKAQVRERAAKTRQVLSKPHDSAGIAKDK